MEDAIEQIALLSEHAAQGLEVVSNWVFCWGLWVGVIIAR